MAKLLVISAIPHFCRDGEIVAHGPTALEISELAALFERVHHIGCFHEGPASALMLPYSSKRVRFIPVPFSGGDSLREKLKVLLAAPKYIGAITREMSELDPARDIVHVRCPSPVGFVAIVALSLLREPRKRWVKYAANWRPGRFDPIGYRLQRWWLKWNFARAAVTVNGAWPSQPRHIVEFVNPCLTRAEIEEGRIAHATKPPLSPLRLLFLGVVHERKGVGRALEIVRRLLAASLDVQLDIVGDGPHRAALETAAADLSSKVRFHGWVPRTAIGSHLIQAHILLFPSVSEGWPKVLSEGMAYGVVPVASNVGSIPQYLGDTGVGITLDPDDLEGYVAAIAAYARDPERWREESKRAVAAAEIFSYDAYLQKLARLLQLDDK